MNTWTWVVVFYGGIAAVWAAMSVHGNAQREHDDSKGWHHVLIGSLWPVTLPLAFWIAYDRNQRVRKWVAEANRKAEGGEAARDKARARYNRYQAEADMRTKIPMRRDWYETTDPKDIEDFWAEVDERDSKGRSQR